MASRTAQLAKRAPNRTLGVRTWLGAGALTLGVGAALAGAAGVAQADTGDHQASSSASSSSSSSHEAGPKRSAGVASSKRVSASAVKVNKSPVSAAAVSSPSASARSAASKTAIAAAIPAINQSIDTPFGPISLVANVTAPDLGTSGSIGVDVTADTPLGGAAFSLVGDQTFTTTPSPKSTTTLTGGTLVVPPTVAFTASVAGAFISAGLTAYDSLNTFFTAASSGNVGGAIFAWAEAAPKFTNALLFGTRTLDLPIQTGVSGPTIVAHIPVGGLFSPARPVSVSWDDYSAEQSGVQVALVGGSIEFAGSTFGGAAPAFFKIFGL